MMSTCLIKPSIMVHEMVIAWSMYPHYDQMVCTKDCIPSTVNIVCHAQSHVSELLLIAWNPETCPSIIETIKIRSGAVPRYRKQCFSLCTRHPARIVIFRN